ncbi:MAG: glycosyltransferase [Deltaproteobacteria bacterium]
MNRQFADYAAPLRVRSEQIDEAIPPRYHYVWFGSDFPLMNSVAIQSCLRHCPGANVTLWHSHVLDGELEYRRLRQLGVHVELLSAQSLLHPLVGKDLAFDAARLEEIWNAVESHVARSNIARAAILYRWGGIYLDTDTLVMRDLAPLRVHRAFLGTEHILWPQGSQRRLGWHTAVRGPVLGTLRRIGGQVRDGDRLYRRVRDLYSRAVNGAVFGARPAHPAVARLLEETTRVPRSEWNIKHRLGTHVLQRTLAGYHQPDLEILPPDVFYPLGPEWSRQYFRPCREPDAVAARILTPATHVLHWYASVSDLSKLGPEQLQSLAKRTAFGALCAPYLRGSARPEFSP